MAATEADLQSFNEFAQQRLNNGGADSIQQLFQEWLEARETTEVVRAVRDGEAELDAGGGQPAAEAVAEVRKRLGWT